MGWTQEVSNCSELKHLCDLPEARLLRMVCGSTCGCTDPLSQPFHKVGTWIFMGKTGRLWYDHFIYHFHGYFWPSPKRGGAWWLYRFMLETWRAGAGERWMQGPATWRLGWTFSLGTGQVWFRVNLVASPSFSPGERWRIFWDTYPDALSDFFGNNMSLLRRLIFFWCPTNFWYVFFFNFVGMFVFGQGFDEELLRPKQPKQQGFFVGDQGQERWCILRSNPWWQRWKSEDVLVCKIPLCSLHLCMKLKDECRNFTWTLTCSKAWWWCANCSLSCRFCCSNSVACSDLGRCRALSFHFSVRR